MQCSPLSIQVQTTAERGYDHQWRKLSETEREKRPICEVCDVRGKSTPVEHLHHIAKVRDAPELRLVVSNTVAVCKDCHQEIEGMGAMQLALHLEQIAIDG